MAATTVISVGSVTIPATGGATGDLLAKITSAGVGAVTQVTNASPTLPAAPTTPGTYTLAIPSTYTGSLSVPSGYTYVVYSGTGSVGGGDSKTTLIGDNLTYTGGAGSVIGTGSSGKVIDTASSAVLSFVSGSYTVNASGGTTTVNLDNGTTAIVTVSGNGSTINNGTPSTNVATGAVAALASSSQNTISATGSSQVVLDYEGSALVNLGGGDMYLGGHYNTASTVVGTGGADTVFATSALDFIGTAASVSTFIGSDTAAVTVASALNQTVFSAGGGSAANGGNLYNVGAASTASFSFVGRYEASVTGNLTTDSIVGTANSPTISVFSSNEDDVIISQAGTGKALNAGNSLVDYGEATTINATHSAGGDKFVIFNEAYSNPGGNFAGNSTLVGSNAGNDLFGVYSYKGFGGSAPVAHTVTIENWVTSDILGIVVSGGGSYTTQDESGLLAALQAGKGGSVSYTLSDGTKISFVNASPTHESVQGNFRYFF